MFENFGILDIWSAIKRYRNWVVLLLIVAIVTGGIYGYREANNTNAKVIHAQDRTTYRNISTYGVTTNDAENTTNNQAIIYINIFKTQPARQYIIDDINEKYTPEQLSGMLGISLKTELTYEDLSPFVQVARITDTPVFAVITQTFDQQLSLDIDFAFRSYIENILIEEINNAFAFYLDSTEEIYRAGVTIPSVNKAGIYEGRDLDVSGSPIAEVSKKSAMLKYMFLFAVIGAVIAIVLATIKALVQPTLNRKSDFAKYDVPVISEIAKIGQIRSK